MSRPEVHGFVTLTPDTLRDLAHEQPFETRYQWGVDLGKDEPEVYIDRDTAVRAAAKRGGSVVCRVHQFGRWTPLEDS